MSHKVLTIAFFLLQPLAQAQVAFADIGFRDKIEKPLHAIGSNNDVLSYCKKMVSYHERGRLTPTSTNEEVISACIELVGSSDDPEQRKLLSKSVSEVLCAEHGVFCPPTKHKARLPTNCTFTKERLSCRSAVFLGLDPKKPRIESENRQ